MDMAVSATQQMKHQEGRQEVHENEDYLSYMKEKIVAFYFIQI